MDAALVDQFVDALRAIARPIIEDEVRRAVADAKQEIQPPAQPLGIDPQKLYSRKEAADLLQVDPTTIWRAENSRGLKRRGPTSRPKYLGADLLKLAKVREDVR